VTFNVKLNDMLAGYKKLTQD